MFKKVIVIDGRAHLLGRLAGTVAKELRHGQKIVVVRCEEINISGSLFRNKMKFQRFLRLRTNSNPKKGPLHYRAPCKIFWRSVRGMLPYKTFSGGLALQRLKMFDGMPPAYERAKKLVVPSALRVLRLKPNADYCRLGDLSVKVGWHHNDLIQRLEEKRKVRADAYFKKKKELNYLKKQATEFANTQIPAEHHEFLKTFYPV